MRSNFHIDEACGKRDLRWICLWVELGAVTSHSSQCSSSPSAPMSAVDELVTSAIRMCFLCRLPSMCTASCSLDEVTTLHMSQGYSAACLQRARKDES